MPISTPLIACTAITAWASRPSSCVPLRVGAQAEGDALDADLDDPAQRVAGPLHLVDQALISSS